MEPGLGVSEALLTSLAALGLGGGFRGWVGGDRLPRRRQQIVQVRLEQIVDGGARHKGLPYRRQRIVRPVKRDVEKRRTRVRGGSRRGLSGEADDPLDPFPRELARRKVLHRGRFQGPSHQGIASRDRAGPPLPPAPSPPPRATLVSRAPRAFPLTPHSRRRVPRRGSPTGLVRPPGGDRAWLSNHLSYGSRLRSPVLSCRSIAAVHSRQDGSVRQASPLPHLRRPRTKLSTYVLIWRHVTVLARRIPSDSSTSA